MDLRHLHFVGNPIMLQRSTSFPVPHVGALRQSSSTAGAHLTLVAAGPLQAEGLLLGVVGSACGRVGQPVATNTFDGPS